MEFCEKCNNGNKRHHFAQMKLQLKEDKHKCTNDRLDTISEMSL